MTTATTGTGTLVLGSAVPGFLTFALAGVTDGQVVSYGIRDGGNSEVGTGTYTSAGTNLTRTVSKSTNSDTAISLSGNAQVYISALKEDIVNLREVNTISSTQFNFNDTTLQIADGTATDFWPDGGKVNIARTSIRMAQYASFTADAFGPRLEFAKSAGATLGSMTTVGINDELMRITAWGANGTGWNRAGYLSIFADGVISGGGAADMPGRFVVHLSPDGSATPTEVFRADSSGNVFTFGLTGVLGYGPASGGAGGTVTQLTSRTTGVTINKVCGAINIFSAAGSTTATTFTVTNSRVTSLDMVMVLAGSGTNTYLAWVSAIANGSFNITFQTTGGTATDTPFFNFMILKGQTT